MDIKKVTLTFASAMMIGTSAFADGDIKGRVIDRGTSEPLEFVSVQLVNPSTGAPMPLGATTDTNGEFVIAGVPSGEYNVRISNLGSVTQERPVRVADSTVDLGQVGMVDDTKLLQEVTVTAQRSQMTVNADKRVFNVSTNITSSGISAEELLASVPSVDVNGDGDISLRGNTDVLVWINGREMGMNADNRSQFLRQIPAETIESIEVMTNPSAKYSTEGTAGIINIRLKEDHRHGYYGTAEAGVDTHGSVNANLNINYNSGKFQSFAGLGLKSKHIPGGVTSRRTYDDGHFLNSEGDNKKHENSIFLRLGTNYNPDEHNLLYFSAIGTLGHKWAHTTTTHFSNLPGQWVKNFNDSHESGDTRGANLLLGYKHTFGHEHSIDFSVSYNIWKGPNDNNFNEDETYTDGTSQTIFASQHQDVTISNWEAAIDYNKELLPWLEFEAGYKGNYNRENSPASYASGVDADNLLPLNDLYNRFKYTTDISALYVNFAGSKDHFTYSAGLRGELWQIRTRSLGFGQTDADVPQFKKNDFALFPSASLGWEFDDRNELKLNYSRRINRPFGPQLNTFENIADPSEVHLGNPLIMPEYSNAVELNYVHSWGEHMLSASGYLRASNDMISHVSFLAPMPSDPTINTMYYGHANVGNMMNTGVEIISRNNLFSRLTLTTTVNLYNSHLKAWTAEYPLHDIFYPIYGKKQDRFVWDLRCMASVRLPWDISFQATGRYTSRRVAPQGVVEPDWDVEAGVKKTVGDWAISLICKDIFDSKKTHNILYGNGYTQSINKWSEGRTLRLAVTFNFGKSHTKHDDHDEDGDHHDHDSHEHHNEINTGGYGDDGHNHNH